VRQQRQTDGLAVHDFAGDHDGKFPDLTYYDGKKYTLSSSRCCRT